MKLENELSRKCEIYECEGLDADRLVCYDWLKVEESESYFGKEPSDGKHTELANILRQDTVSRRGSKYKMKEWIDARTSRLEFTTVFSIPDNGVTTELKLEWLRPAGDYSGRFEGTTILRSYRSIANHEFTSFVLYCAAIIAITLFDIVSGIRGVQQRLLDRNKLVVDLDKKGKDFVNSHMRPAVTLLDVFDFAFRFGMLLVTFIIFWSKLTDGNGLSTLDKIAQRILNIPWGSREQTMEQKFETLFKGQEEIAQSMQQEEALRTCSFLILLLMVMRAIVYAGCHPRIAVLYATVVVSLDDMFHFFILFVLIFGVFAFGAHYGMGSEDPAFASLQSTLYTQFQMLFGEIPFAPSASVTNVTYLVSFFLVITVVLLNYLLAVIVGAYDKVKEAIVESSVEANVLTDVYVSCWSRYKQNLSRTSPKKWPDDVTVLTALDECKAEDVSLELLLSLRDKSGELLFPEREGAEEYFDTYSNMYKNCIDPMISIDHQLEEEQICFAARLSKSKSDDVAGLDPDAPERQIVPYVSSARQRAENRTRGANSETASMNQDVELLERRLDNLNAAVDTKMAVIFELVKARQAATELHEQTEAATKIQMMYRDKKGQAV